MYATAVWKSVRNNMSASSRTYRYSGAKSAFPTGKCSTLFSTWLSTVASGGDCPKAPATRTRSMRRKNCWSKGGVLDRIFAALQEERNLRVRLEVVVLDNIDVKSQTRA